MRYLKANTQVIVTIGPFVDVGDGFTPETGITLGAADEAELLKHGSTSVVDISGATWAAVTNCDGYYSLTLTTSHTDTEGQLIIVVQDDSACLPVKAEFQVLAEAAYDSLYTAKDSGYMDVNVKAVSEDTTAADNLELITEVSNITSLNVEADGMVHADVKEVGGTAQTANDNGADINAILTDTNELQTDWTNGGRLDLIIDAILADTNELQSDDIPGTLSTIAGYLDTEIAAIIDAVITNAAGADIAADIIALKAVADDVPTTAEFEARTLAAAAYFDPAADTVALVTDITTKTGFSLSVAGNQAIWDLASALTLDFGTLTERIYQLLNNELNITDADGSAALRNLADSADIATGSITDNGTTTSRAAYSWV